MSFKVKRSRLLAAFGVLFALVLTIHACTEVDDTLGQSFIPRNQQMDMFVRENWNVSDSRGGIFTHLYKVDSLVSNNSGYLYLGQEESPVFGKRRNSAVIQFLPAYLPPEDEGYGYKPIVDSLCLYLPLSQWSGDTTQEQIFDVYKIHNANDIILRYDSTFYTFFDPTMHEGEQFVDLGAGPLFTFKLSGRTTPMNPKLEIVNSDSWDYMQKFVTTSIEDYYTDSLFHQQFQGLYITPKASSPAAATYGIDLSKAYLRMFGRIHDEVDLTAIADTISNAFALKDQSTRNVSINIVDFDFSGSDLGALEGPTNNFTDTLTTSIPLSTIYVQTMGGVTGMLRFTQEMVEEIQNLKYGQADGNGNPVNYDNIMINQAMLYLELEHNPSFTTDYENMNNAMTRVGSYSNLRKIKGIPDYAFVTELYYQTKNDENYILPYNGYLSRSNQQYVLNITAFIQDLVNGTGSGYDDLKTSIYIAPEATAFFGLKQSILKGCDANTPLKFKVTYTLIKNNG